MYIKVFGSVFGGLEQISGNIKLLENAKPVIQYSGKAPFSLHGKLKETINSSEEKGVVEEVEYPTQWVNNLLIVKKPTNKLRLCIDPKLLNKYISREHFAIPISNDIVSKFQVN